MAEVVTAVGHRARLSGGTSGVAIYAAVARELAGRSPGGVLVDVGCGAGNLWAVVAAGFDRYVGVDAVRYAGFPVAGEFLGLDLDAGRAPLPDGVADVVTAVETIEHLENPRAFLRELTRLCKPNGWVLVTTPNQLSLLSTLTLVAFGEFNAFRASSYPAHLTALLAGDLRRIAGECGLADVRIAYTLSGRVPGTARMFPAALSRRLPRLLSDNVLLVGRKPPSGGAA
jgi:SAM-dependent methyltransferase